ncbi:sulfite exporter TauE/SafE family protein [bacterium]|nr:sulfite exporter TauE/SafE family protein [bacterium]
MDSGFLLPLLILVAAALYSAVGHAGASAYLAAMALAGIAPAVMKPAALGLNVLVAVIATAQYARAGCFSWRLLLPFAAGSIPAAYLGGAITLPGSWYRPLVGAVLLLAAARLLTARAPAETGRERPPGLLMAVPTGAAIGLLAGLTGTGGGIFLSPLLMLAGWAGPRRAAGAAAAFILVNSLAGLAGLARGGAAAVTGALPPEFPLWALAAVAGGLVGSHCGSRRLDGAVLRRLLAVVLVVAAGKMIAVA